MDRAVCVMDTQCLLCEVETGLLNITSTVYDRTITGGCIKLHNDKLHDCIPHQSLNKSRTSGVWQVTRA